MSTADKITNSCSHEPVSWLAQSKLVGTNDYQSSLTDVFAMKYISTWLAQMATQMIIINPTPPEGLLGPPAKICDNC